MALMSQVPPESTLQGADDSMGCFFNTADKDKDISSAPISWHSAICVLNRNNGIVERWNVEEAVERIQESTRLCPSILPIFHFSNIPLVSGSRRDPANVVIIERQKNLRDHKGGDHRLVAPS